MTFKERPGWIDVSKQMPIVGSRVLVCDDYGYIDIEDVDSGYQGRSWIANWTFGNGTKIVAWMPLPAWPKDLCHEDADGECP